MQPESCSMMPPLAQQFDALLSRARERDAEALGALLASHEDCVVRLVSARYDPRLSARIDVDDIVQEVWAEAVARFPDYAKDAAIPFPDWLQHVALDCVAHCRRAHIGTKKRSVCAEAPQFAAQARRRPRNAADSGEPPLEHCANCELYEKMEALMSRLADADRALLRLRIVERRPSREVGAKLGMTQSGVWARQLRLLRWLRERLADEPSGGQNK
jgi:RNA polymerase sigma-70 factor (ECF subfamily)